MRSGIQTTLECLFEIVCSVVGKRNDASVLLVPYLSIMMATQDKPEGMQFGIHLPLETRSAPARLDRDAQEPLGF